MDSASEVSARPKGACWRRAAAAILDGVLVVALEICLSRLLGSGLGNGLAALCGVGYYVCFWAKTGQTFGARALSLKVLRTDGGRVDMVTALIRFTGLVLSIVPLGLGLIWAAFDSQSQGWHDKLAHTYVLKLGTSQNMASDAGGPTASPGL